MLAPSVPIPDPPLSPSSSRKKLNVDVEDRELWTIIEQARNYIHELELRHLEDQNRINSALNELKQSAAREEDLLQRVSKLEQEQSVRDILSAQKEQTRVNMALMRSLEDIVKSTKQESHANNNLRSQMLEALQKTIFTDTTNNITERIPTTNITPSSTSTSPRPSPPSKSISIPTSTKTSPNNSLTTLSNKHMEYDILVHISQDQKLGCAFDHDWNVTGFRNKSDGTMSTMEAAGVLVGDQLIAIHNRNILLDWPSRASIINFLRDGQSKGEGQMVRFLLRRKKDATMQEKDGTESVLFLTNRTLLSTTPSTTPSTPTTPTAPSTPGLFVSTPTGKWRQKDTLMKYET